jgi:hypothetical protein
MASKRGKAETVTAWKGTDKNLQCLGFQFEVGKTYTHEGSVAACSSGFHACRNPMDVWSYYPLGDGNRFFRVQLSGKTSEHDGDTKIAAETIYVETEVTLGEMIKAGVKHTIDATLSEAKDERFLAASGDSSQLAASGNYSQLAASGYSSRLAASGENSVIAASAPACTAKGAEGTWISLAEFKDGKCIGFATGCIGKDGLLPDTDYIAKGGKLVSA